MPNYIRSKVEGAMYFFTVVTYGRRRVFHLPLARRILREAFTRVRAERPWETTAIVLLPDRMHMIWRLPDGDAAYSWRIGKIKASFTKGFLGAGGGRSETSTGEARKRYAGLWQPRFWEHTIRDARDFHVHLDYIHINPVKHRLVALPRDWPWSSFHRYVKMGWYEPDWCGRVDLPGSLEYLE